MAGLPSASQVCACTPDIWSLQPRYVKQRPVHRYKPYVYSLLTAAVPQETTRIHGLNLPEADRLAALKQLHHKVTQLGSAACSRMRCSLMSSSSACVQRLACIL